MHIMNIQTICIQQIHSKFRFMGQKTLVFKFTITERAKSRHFQIANFIFEIPTTQPWSLFICVLWTLYYGYGLSIATKSVRVYSAWQTGHWVLSLGWKGQQLQLPFVTFQEAIITIRAPVCSTGKETMTDPPYNLGHEEWSSLKRAAQRGRNKISLLLPVFSWHILRDSEVCACSRHNPIEVNLWKCYWATWTLI